MIDSMSVRRRGAREIFLIFYLKFIQNRMTLRENIKLEVRENVYMQFDRGKTCGKVQSMKRRD